MYEKAKAEGKNPKFVMDKLFIDGVEYQLHQALQLPLRNVKRSPSQFCPGMFGV